MRRLLLFLLAAVFVSSLIACDEPEPSVTITLEISSSKQTLDLEEEVKLVINTNDEEGYTINILDDTIISIDDNLMVKGLKEGISKIVVTSVTDESLIREITFNVIELIKINISPIDEVLWVGETYQLNANSNDDIEYSVDDESIAAISESGVISLYQTGEVEVTVKSVSNPNVKESIIISIHEFGIEGQSKVNVNTTKKINGVKGPNDLYNDVVWSVSNEEIATIDEDGEMTFHKVGKVVVTATISDKPYIFAKFNVDVLNEFLIDASKAVGDKVTIDNLEFVFGERLFNDLETLKELSLENSLIRIAKIDLENEWTIGLSDVELVGEDLTIAIPVIVEGNNISLSNFKFINGAIIKNDIAVSGLTIKESTFENLSTTNSAIDLINVSNLTIINNEFSDFDADAITIVGFSTGLINIEKNTISNVKSAIKVSGSTYDKKAVLNFIRNDISNVLNGFDVDLGGINIDAFARFNSLSEFSGFAAKTNADNQMDYTLNYWGTSELDPSKFINVQLKYLMSHYETKESIMSEKDYDPRTPILLFLTNEVPELSIKDTSNQFIEWEWLPYELKSPSFRVTSSDGSKLTISNKNGKLTALQSGLVTITIASSRDLKVSVTTEVSVITDPGIYLRPSTKDSSILVGEQLYLEATPFPYTLENETLVFESSNNGIATIDENGLIVSKSSGKAVFTVKLASNNSILETYHLEFYDNLDENNLMDLLTMNQTAYSEMYSWHAIGAGFSYADTKYESVSRYYFGDIVVDDTRILPISTGLVNGVPGAKRNPIPEGLPRYNESHTYWVVVHDTANTSPGSGALSHSNYLWSQYRAGGNEITSWHYTMDDLLMIQHVREDEVAWHAGDGSSLPGQGSYAGGGNRNGIGIEMSVAQFDDVYRIWQRTAKFAAQALIRHGLPRSHQKFHQDFSGKLCPNTLIHSGLMPYFVSFVDIEYEVASKYADAQITMESHNPEILDNNGRIISHPEEAVTVSYTITIVRNSETITKTFNTFIPGTLR